MMSKNVVHQKSEAEVDPINIRVAC